MALSGSSSGLISERINESKGGGVSSLLCFERQKPKAPNRNVNGAGAGRTGTHNPLLPFLDPTLQSCPSLITRPSGLWKWTPISTLHPMPAGYGSCPLTPLI